MSVSFIQFANAIIESTRARAGAQPAQGVRSQADIIAARSMAPSGDAVSFHAGFAGCESAVMG